MSDQVIMSGTPAGITVHPDRLSKLATTALEIGIRAGRREALGQAIELAGQLSGAELVAALRALLPVSRVEAERERLSKRAQEGA